MDDARSGTPDAILLGPVSRLPILVLAGLVAPTLVLGWEGSLDPVFSTVPFEQWLSQPNQSRMRWTLHLSDPELSPHQRWAVTLDVQVDGAELAKRRGEGHFLILVQVSDESNRVWQNHQEIDLGSIPEGTKGNDTVCTQSFFAVPGFYNVAVALFDTARGEHSVVQRRLRVNPVKNDPLPEMWSDLPAIEFFTPGSSRDRWFLPSVAGRLTIATETRRAVEVDLLVNLTPAERLSGSARIQNRNLEALIPSAKVLAQVEWRNAKLNVEFLDLARRRVAYRQNNVDSLDWPGISDALEQANPGVIDIRSLANRRYNADFFLNRIARRVHPLNQTVAPPRIVIVLSTVVFFEPGVETNQIAISPTPDATVIYIRYQPRPGITINPEGRPRRTIPSPGPADQIEPLLKPLAPHLFEVHTPEEFRRSLAKVLDLAAKW